MTTSSRHVARSHSHLFKASPEAVFPLLCPTREYDWIPIWTCELVHSVSGFAEQDCVFVTDFPNLGREVWLQTRHEPSRAVEFARIGEGRAMRYTVELLPAPEGTALCVTQRVTYLDDEAARTRIPAEDALFAREMPGLMRLIEHYLETGRMMTKEELEALAVAR